MATTTETEIEFIPLDTSDVDRWMGTPLGGSEMKEPVYENDIRRWTQAQHNPNKLHYDESFAEESVFGRLVAPLSFAVACDTGHGAVAAIQGTIPGSHMLFGGDEWWFYGPRIYPGDLIRGQRLAFDYRVTNTAFAGPTMFQRGDTTYFNQHGRPVAKQRSTAIRYIVENAARLASFSGMDKDPEWSDEEIERFKQGALDYYRTFTGHVLKTASDVKQGEALPRRVIGPHSINSFVTEYKAFIAQAWSSHKPQALPSSSHEAGWLPEMSGDQANKAVNPRLADGLTHGASRGHTQERYAQLIGMPRGYGYGASMGSWVLDYVANWAGEYSFVTHSKIQYRNPALTGDVTFLDGEVASIAKEPGGTVLVTVDVVMQNQNDTVMAKGPVEVRLPVDAP